MLPSLTQGPLTSPFPFYWPKTVVNEPSTESDELSVFANTTGTEIIEVF
jgi:hypothetical protein